MLPVGKPAEITKNLKTKTLISLTIQTYNINAMNECVPPPLKTFSVLESLDDQDEEVIEEKAEKIIGALRECLI
jgi:hypothetical protein